MREASSPRLPASLRNAAHAQQCVSDTRCVAQATRSLCHVIILFFDYSVFIYLFIYGDVISLDPEPVQSAFYRQKLFAYDIYHKTANTEARH